MSLHQWPEKVIPRLPVESLHIARKLATDKGRGQIDNRLLMLALSRLVELTESMQVATPDGPSLITTKAYVLLALLGAGFDHRMPSVFQHEANKIVRQLLEEPIETLSSSEQALVIWAIAEDYAMSNDPALKGLTRFGYKRMLDGGAEARWSSDNEYVMQVILAFNAVMVGDENGLPFSEDKERIRLWWKEQGPLNQWMVHGREQECPAWMQAAWEGCLYGFMQDTGGLHSVSLEMPPLHQRGTTIASWWCSKAAILQGQTTYKAMTVPLANFARKNSAIFKPWKIEGAKVSTEQICAWTFAIMHIELDFQGKMRWPVAMKPTP